MITTEEYKQMQAYARIDGVFLAVIWIGSFACYIAGLTSPLTGMLASLSAIASPFFVANRLKIFRSIASENNLSLMRGAAYYLMVFFYGSLLFAMAQFVYLAYLDNGYLFSTYMEVFQSDEAKSMLTAYGMNENEMKLLSRTMEELTPLDFSLNVLTMNIMIGALLSFPVAFYVTKTQHISNDNNKNQ